MIFNKYINSVTTVILGYLFYYQSLKMKQQITILTKKYENLLNKVQDLENTTDYLEERVSEQQNKITNNDYNIRHKMEDLVNTNYVFIE